MTNNALEKLIKKSFMTGFNLGYRAHVRGARDRKAAATAARKSYDAACKKFPLRTASK